MLNKAGYDTTNYHLGYWSSRSSLQDVSEAIDQYYDKYDKIPRYEDLTKFKTLPTIISEGKWERFGICSYHDLIIHCGYEPTQHEHGYWQGRSGLKNAVIEIKERATQLGRTPIFNEINTSIRTNANRGVWSQFGINSFLDLQEYAGLEPNVIYWEGKEGLQKAKERVLEHYQKNKRVPLTSKLGTIGAAISKGYWQDFGISSSSDLIRACGLTPRRKSPRIVDRKPNGYWDGKKGLNRAISVIREYMEERNRLPVQDEMRKISSQAFMNKWVDYRISIWSDVLEYTIFELVRQEFEFGNNLRINILDRTGIKV